MSILKTKVANAIRLQELKKAQAKTLLLEQSPVQSYASTGDELISINLSPTEKKLDFFLSPTNSSPKRIRSKKEGTCQNIIKNYSRAFTNFALSSAAQPYLKPTLLEQGLTLEEFNLYINRNKSKINCIKNLRNALFIKSNDSEKMRANKRTFQKICEVFLKYFSVNWVFNSRVDNKKTHLEYRFKILRRVRQPEYFTYLEGYTSNPLKQ